MKTVKTFAQQLSFSLMMAMTLGSAIVSCGSILDEEDVDCSVEYRVKFKYEVCRCFLTRGGDCYALCF